MKSKDASLLMLAVAMLAFVGASQLASIRIASTHPMYTNRGLIGSEAKQAITRLRSSRDTTVCGVTYHNQGGESGENEYITKLGQLGRVPSGEDRGR